ncbi:MAG: 50S ribosomal protein L35 [Chloroflexi bacterium]|nr:50S ribosomal protein L35 [Chloroflexota bacterium]
MPRKAPKGKYKLKTHRATAKRFKVTGSGKLMRTKGGKGHLRRNTSKRSKALFSKGVEVKTQRRRSENQRHHEADQATRALLAPSSAQSVFVRESRGILKWQE